MLLILNEKKTKNMFPPYILNFAQNFFNPKLESPDLKYKEKIIDVRYVKDFSEWKIFPKSYR